MEWDGFNLFWVTALLEIVILACIFYYTFRFLQGTRGAQVLTGLVVALVFLFGITYFFHLDVLNWLLSKMFVYLAIGFLVIFQPEIRHALAQIGRPGVFTAPQLKIDVVDQIVQAASFLAERRIGALIAVEREVGIRSVQETGVRVDSSVSWGLLASIFFPHTPLHDGGVVICRDRIVAAGCLFPLSERGGLNKMLGTRHRAAIGLSEETDAVVVVVSEETGKVSVGYHGSLTLDIEIDRLRRFLARELLKSEEQERGAFFRVRKWFGLTFNGDEVSGGQPGDGKAGGDEQ